MREEDYPLRNDTVWNYLHVLYRVHMLRESNERNVILDQENMFNPLFIAVAVNKSNNFIEQFLRNSGNQMRTVDYRVFLGNTIA